MAWSVVNLYNQEALSLKSLHCITFKYTCFHIATRRFYLFMEEIPILGAGGDGGPYKTRMATHPHIRTSVPMWTGADACFLI